MARVLILHTSLSGKSEKMAEAFAEGAQSVQGTEVVTKKAFDATREDLLNCDAVAFGPRPFQLHHRSTQAFL